jgi:hypothetical protein
MSNSDSAPRHPAYVTVPVTVLAIAGMLDLLFERIVYRIGIHIPKDPAVMNAYRGATHVGDGAFRFAVVLAVFAAGATALYLFRQPSAERRLVGAALLAVAVLDTITIGAGGPWIAMAVVVAYGASLALLLGIAAGSRLAWAARAAAISAGVALLAGEFPLFATRAGDLSLATLPGATIALTVAESALLAAALLLFAWARPWTRPAGAYSFAAGALVAAIVALAWHSAPATVAILALWGAGVTMAFPAPIYLVALGLAVAAAVAFALDANTRPMAVAVVLLAVAGLQPTVTQYNIPALLGMVILVLGSPSVVPAAAGEPAEQPDVDLVDAGHLALQATGPFAG